MNEEELIKETCNKIEDHIFNNLCDDPDYFEFFMTEMSEELYRRWCSDEIYVNIISSRSKLNRIESNETD